MDITVVLFAGVLTGEVNPTNRSLNYMPNKHENNLAIVNGIQRVAN
jgi:hypothetical protein